MSLEKTLPLIAYTLKIVSIAYLALLGYAMISFAGMAAIIVGSAIVMMISALVGPQTKAFGNNLIRDIAIPIAAGFQKNGMIALNICTAPFKFLGFIGSYAAALFRRAPEVENEDEDLSNDDNDILERQDEDDLMQRRPNWRIARGEPTSLDFPMGSFPGYERGPDGTMVVRKVPSL